MCGIAGVFGKFSGKFDESVSNVLLDSLKHRGPDGQRKYIDNQVALLHTRLSIIDLSESGNQPLFSSDGSIVLVCNGEIYNYKELRSELATRNHQFVSHSDCEVLIHLYLENADNPERMLQRLTGMFAFALWDKNRQRLLIGRDRLGIKPLYYHQSGNDIAFASEVKPLVNSRLSNFSIDPTSLFEYFVVGNVPGPNTLYKEIKSLEPGHYINVTKDKTQFVKYWDISPELKSWKNQAEVNEAVEELLAKVVNDHLVADVPVGTFLSAGIDSSLVTYFATRSHPAIETFTASFPGEEEDEGEIAHQTAQKLGIRNELFELKNNFFVDINEQFKNFDQPFGNTSALSLGRISKEAQKKIKVVLSGDGADELFAGYYRHIPPPKPRFLNYIPEGLQDPILRLGALVTNKESLKKLRKNLNTSEMIKYAGKIWLNQPDYIASFLNPDILKQIDFDRFLNRMQNIYSSFPQNDAINRLLYVDIKTTLVDEMLTKCDRMTMMNSIECRVPFLDHRMVELAFSIPSSYKIQNNFGKIPLRSILESKLGHDLAYRRKTGFNSPLKKWIMEDSSSNSFAKENIGHIKHPDLFNDEKMKELKFNFTANDSSLIFSLICFNIYFANSN